jgi:hypothetical protein
MDLIAESVSESVSAFEATLVTPPDDETSRSELHAEINQRRAQIENSEMLRRLRSL